MQQVFVSIGSNIDPRNNIEEARIILGNLFDCTFSGLYETRAEGFEETILLTLLLGLKLICNL